MHPMHSTTLAQHHMAELRTQADNARRARQALPSRSAASSRGRPWWRHWATDPRRRLAALAIEPPQPC